MPSLARMSACLISLLVMGGGASHAAAQTVELKSVQLTALHGTEKDRFLAAHNAARKAVGVDSAQWSDELSKVALESLGQQKDRMIEDAKEGWANEKFALPDHRTDNKYAENIAGWRGNKVPGSERAVAWWLEEKTAFDKLNASGSYKFGDEEGETETDADGKERPVVVGHYTAIVWRATTHLGAAKLTFQLADDRGVVRTYVAVVCNYYPAGNIEGEQPF